jgi:hypothetical protein
VRDHLLSMLGADNLDQMGVTPDQFLQLVKAQTTLIMTMPFDQLDLMMLMPTALLPEDERIEAPTSLRGWWKTIQEQRRRQRDGELSLLEKVPQPRGELLLIKQLVFFERYGKLFLGSQPLIYDAEVYKALLALPQFDAPAA